MSVTAKFMRGRLNINAIRSRKKQRAKIRERQRLLERAGRR